MGTKIVTRSVLEDSQTGVELDGRTTAFIIVWREVGTDTIPNHVQFLFVVVDVEPFAVASGFVVDFSVFGLDESRLELLLFHFFYPSFTLFLGEDIIHHKTT